MIFYVNVYTQVATSHPWIQNIPRTPTNNCPNGNHSSNLYNCRLIMPTLEFYIHAIIKSYVLKLGLFLPTLWLQDSSTLLCIAVVYSFSLLFCKCTVYFSIPWLLDICFWTVYFSIPWSLDICFRTLNTYIYTIYINIMNILVYKFLYTQAFIYVGIIPRIEFLDQVAWIHLINHFSKGAVAIYTPSSKCKSSCSNITSILRLAFCHRFFSV